jgi:hypothetical protein
LSPFAAEFIAFEVAVGGPYAAAGYTFDEASRRVSSEKPPIVVMQRTCRQCRKVFKIHCYKPYITAATPQFFAFGCPYCAEPLREELPGAIFRIERVGRP